MKKNERKAKQEDTSLDTALRPKNWDEYTGQRSVKKNLRIIIEAARQRGESLEHILLHGPSGLGKTTLAHLIAKEVGSNIKTTSGPAIEKVGDLASILTNLSDHDVLFIDEAHRLNKLIEEVLYPAMENRTLDIVIGKGPSARIIQLELPSFTLIAATTRIALLSSPLRSRFSGGTFRLDFYTDEDVRNIIYRSALILNLVLTPEGAGEIIRRSRGTPRIANRLLKRCRDYAQVHEIARVDENAANETFALMDVDEKGLEPVDRQILKIIIEKFNGGPVGIHTITASLQDAEDTIEEVYEPYLLQLGFLERTSRGRIVTPAAYKHLGIEQPKQDYLL